MSPAGERKPSRSFFIPLFTGSLHALPRRELTITDRLSIIDHREMGRDENAFDQGTQGSAAGVTRPASDTGTLSLGKRLLHKVTGLAGRLLGAVGRCVRQVTDYLLESKAVRLLLKLTMIVSAVATVLTGLGYLLCSKRQRS